MKNAAEINELKTRIDAMEKKIQDAWDEFEKTEEAIEDGCDWMEADLVEIEERIERLEERLSRYREQLRGWVDPYYGG